MTPDYHWFYSTLAQATAAVVGLTGGLLAARIVDHVAGLQAEHARVVDLVRDAAYHVFERGASLGGLLTLTELELDSTEAVLRKGETTRVVDHIHWDGRPSEKISVSGVDALRGRCEGWREDIVFLNRVLPLYKMPVGSIDTARLFRVASALFAHADDVPFIRGVAQANMRVDADVIAAVATSVTRLRARLLPRSLLFVLSLLAWLTATGVMWPLLALEGLPGEFGWFGKGWMLLSLAAGIAALMVFLVWQLRQARALGFVEWPAPPREWWRKSAWTPLSVG